MTELIKKLSGHSGCSLELFQQNNSYFVRKTSGSSFYNTRLKKQLLKQRSFRSSELKTPKILGYGFNKDLFYFDMEYVSGTTLDIYAKNISLSEISHLIKLLFNSFNVKYSKKNPKSLEIFRNKIAALKNELHFRNESITQSFEILQKFNFSDIPNSFCCGDLTLENIIVTPNRQIYLIDFLDSFYESYLMDIAKLFQDLELGWSFRKTKIDFNTNLRLNIAKHSIRDKILNLENVDGERMLIAVYHILLLNVLRIYPYTTDKETLNFLDKSLLKVLSIIKDLSK